MKHYQLALGIPLGLLPAYQRLRDEINASDFQFEEQQIGVFNVVRNLDFDPSAPETNSISREENLVVFGGNHVYPSCTCVAWCQTHVPCIHMFAIFRFVPGWKYDSMSALYRINPLFDIDYSACTPEPLDCQIAERADVGCQITTKLAYASQKELQSSPRPTSKIFVSETPTSIPLLINLKNFKTQIEELDQVFSDKRYRNHLHTELDSLIGRFEEKLKAATSRKNSNLGSSLSSSGLRQTSEKFVSMNEFVSAVPVKKRDALKDVEKLNEERRKIMATIKIPVKTSAKKTVTVKKKSISKNSNDSSDTDSHQIDFARSEK